jgi:3-oxoadipate enol-lactonase
MAHRFHLVEDLNLDDQLRAIKAPTLVMTGDRDVLVSPTSLATLCDGIADATFRRLPGCGHLAFVTKPELIVNQVQDFMDR